MKKNRRFDRVAVVGTLLAFVTTLNYVWSNGRVTGGTSQLFKTIPRGGAAYSSDQANHPMYWAWAVLVVGITLANYGSRLEFRYRRTALLLAAAVLIVMGKLALASGMATFSIGIPLVVAGLICLVAAIRSRGLATGGRPAAK